jgi:hypothetical protein
MLLNLLVAKVGVDAALLDLTMIATISSCLTLFLDYLMDNHPLGQWYLFQLQKLPQNLAKPLGECPVCSGAWQFLFLSILIFDFPIILCLVFLGVNHLLIRFMIFLTSKIKP